MYVGTDYFYKMVIDPIQTDRKEERCLTKKTDSDLTKLSMLLTLIMLLTVFLTLHIFQTLRCGGGRAFLFRGRHQVREGRGPPCPQGRQSRGPPDLIRPRRQSQAREQEARGILWVLK